MPKFQGPKNIILMGEGDEVPYVKSEYDVETGQYAVTLSAADAKKYGDALTSEGMTQVDEKAAKSEKDSGDDA